MPTGKLQFGDERDFDEEIHLSQVVVKLQFARWRQSLLRCNSTGSSSREIAAKIRLMPKGELQFDDDDDFDEELRSTAVLA